MSSNQLTELLNDMDAIFGGNRVLGFTPLANELRSLASQSLVKYPPHNIIRDNENRWYVEVAVAGFSPEELSVEIDDGRLTISGRSNLAEKASSEYLHKGVARRDFNLEFRLGDHIEAEPAVYQNGMLVIPLQRIIPEDKKVRKIEILKA